MNVESKTAIKSMEQMAVTSWELAKSYPDDANRWQNISLQFFGLYRFFLNSRSIPGAIFHADPLIIETAKFISDLASYRSMEPASVLINDASNYVFLKKQAE